MIYLFSQPSFGFQKYVVSRIMHARARSSAGQSTWLRTKGSGVRISSGAPYKTRGQLRLALCHFTERSEFVTLLPFPACIVEKRSTYCVKCSLERWAYFRTISTLSQAPNSCNTCNGVPDCTPQLRFGLITTPSLAESFVVRFYVAILYRHNNHG